MADRRFFFSPKIRGFLCFFGAALSIEAHASRPRSAIVNSECQAAFVAGFEVGPGFASIGANADYCALAAEKVPRPVREILGVLKDANVRVAGVLGTAPKSLYGFGVRVRIRFHPAGANGSITIAGPGTEGVVEIGAFRDFGPAKFPKLVYVHELGHYLLREKKLGQAAAALEERSLFVESFADLLASYAFDALRIETNELDVHASLTEAREFGPLRSMGEALRSFSTYAKDEALLEACKIVLRGRPTANDRSLCGFYRDRLAWHKNSKTLFEDARTPRPSERELGAPFRPEACLVEYRDGGKGVDGCHPAFFSPVFVSFVRAIDVRLGPEAPKEVLRAVDRAARKMDRMYCEFISKEARWRGTEGVLYAVPSVVKGLKALRASYPASSWDAFDAAWRAHRLDVWESFEKLERDTEAANRGYNRLVNANPRFAKTFSCDVDSDSSRPAACAFRCDFLRESDP